MMNETMMINTTLTKLSMNCHLSPTGMNQSSYHNFSDEQKQQTVSVTKPTPNYSASRFER